MRALDLFCGGGGAADGLRSVGFDVVGVDSDARCARSYPGPFVVGDALRPPVELGAFDLIWASPPCPAYSTATPAAARSRHPDLVGPIRDVLQASGVDYVIENVPGAPLRNPVRLAGAMVGLHGIRRERWFELSWFSLFPPFRAGTVGRAILVNTHGIYKTVRMPDGRRSRSRVVKGGNRVARIVMGVGPGRMTRRELGNAVPPPMAAMIGSAWVRDRRLR